MPTRSTSNGRQDTALNRQQVSPPVRRASSLLSDDNESWQTPPQEQDDAEYRNLLQSSRRVLLNDDADHSSGGGWMRAYWLGLGLFLALFAFWLLDSLKDPILGQLVSGDLDRHQPPAKLLSVCTTLFLVCCLEYISSAQPTKQGATVTTKERSAQDVMDGGGTWNRMDLAVAGVDNESTYDAEDENDDQVSSRVFLYVGLPYCLFFGVMASILQYNPRVALTDPSSWLAEQEKNNAAATMNQLQQQHNATTYWHVIGYCLFAAIESFGSLIVATFWSFTNSTLSLVDAENYFGLIVALAQLGAILGSTMVTMRLWSSITLIVLASLVIVLHVIVMRMYSRRFAPTADPMARSIYRRTTSEQPRTSPVSQTHRPRRRDNNLDRSRDEATTTPLPSKVLMTTDSSFLSSSSYPHISSNAATLWSGVYLILKHNYVLLILGTSCLYEVSLTCLNFQMTLLGWSRFEESDHKLSFKQFMGHYGQMVNISSLILSSIVFPFLIKRVGLRDTIRLFPTLLLAANIVAFLALPGNLAVLFFSLSLLKAMTYSIHDPAKEILYIPTSNAIKFKSKFWIDVVGARIAKAIGSTINRYAGSVDRSIRVASAPSLLTAGALWWVCYRVGSQFDVLVETGTAVGALFDEDDHDKFCKVERYRDLYDEDIEDFVQEPNKKQYSDEDAGSIEMQNY